MVNVENTLLVSPEQPLDVELFSGYSQIYSMDGAVSSRLLPDGHTLAAEKTAFLLDRTSYVPNLAPRNIDESAVEQEVETLQSFKRHVIEWDGDADIAQLYRWRINERIANAQLALAASNGDMRRFKAYNYFVYGTPDESLYDDVAAHYLQFAQAKLDAPSLVVRNAAEKVVKRFSETTGYSNRIAPDETLFAAVKSSQFKSGGYFDLVLQHGQLPEGKVSREVGDEILRSVGHVMGVNMNVEDASGLTWSMDAPSATMKRPKDYEMPQTRFVGLAVGHEATHLLEYQNGSRSALRLLATGLDRYEIGNEGRGVIREQVAYETFQKFSGSLRWQMIMRRFLGTALAYGYGSKKETTDFTDTFEVINEIDELYELSKNLGDIDAAIVKAENRSWNLLESIYKGTDGTTPYGRYAIYLAGNVACWEVLKSSISRMDQGDRGKFDISNLRTTGILQQIGIIK